jgi:response regulator RpfG family c-di-GMP phosphodiesterase
VLYVQDSAADTELVRRVLDSSEHDDVAFIGVACKTDALTEIQHGQTPPNLVLLGWSPHSDTVAVLRWLKHEPTLCVIPVLVLASVIRTEDIRRLYDDNASCVIPLPQALEDLERVFHTIKQLWLNHARLPNQDWH